MASFSEAEIASLSAKVIASLNALTILYNSCSVVVSVLVWSLIRKNLIAGQEWAFWVLLFVIGFVEVMAFIASAPIGNARWPGECCSDRFVCCGHWFVWLFPYFKSKQKAV